jgi:hypothetical protein
LYIFKNGKTQLLFQHLMDFKSVVILQFDLFGLNELEMKK